MRKKTLFILIVMFMFLLISCDVKISQVKENVATSAYSLLDFMPDTQMVKIYTGDFENSGAVRIITHVSEEGFEEIYGNTGLFQRRRYKFTSDGLVMDYIENIEDVMGAIPLTSDEESNRNELLIKLPIQLGHKWETMDTYRSISQVPTTYNIQGDPTNYLEITIETKDGYQYKEYYDQDLGYVKTVHSDDLYRTEILTYYDETFSEGITVQMIFDYLDEVHSMQTPLLKDLTESEIMANIPESWDRIWDSVAQSEGSLTDEQIKVINDLLQPYFMDKDQIMMVNPISCFFTSNYSDVKEIDLTEFLRYAPIRESMDNAQEFDLLKVHPNWPFAAHLSLKGMPVPIHRYQREAVEALFYTYAGMRLDELSGVGFDEVIYLESTDAYYNYTSDFGPGLFICEGGEVKGNTIRLFGKSNGNAAPVLTLIQYEGRYVIKAFE